ncbi:MAG TPA: arylsulfatase [Bacteroidales bacterium]|nr:arylsulfatase [Bacteroidales bacterium]
MIKFKFKSTILSLLLFSFTAEYISANNKNDNISPNIVFIFADDMGYGDVSALNPFARTQTPAIDKLVSTGMTFTEAHASASVCTPSRYGLLTGRYAFRSQDAAGGINGFHKSVIEPGRATLATLLKKAGYTTACIGKWHLGVNWQTNKDTGEPLQDEDTGYSNVDYSKKVSGGPNDFGFDYSFIHTASLDIPPYLFIRNHKVTDPDMILTSEHYPRRREDTEYSWDKIHTKDKDIYWGKGVWWRDGEMSQSFRIEDCHTEIVKEGVAYIEKQTNEKHGNPFFLYLPLTGPHTPWMPEEQFKGKSNAGLYGDFILNIDDAVKQINESLIRNGISDNTILIFSSDNGAYWPQEEIERYAHDSNQGSKGQKGDVWDGGHHIPLVVSWPAQIKQPSEYPHLISLTDFYATFRDFTGQKQEKNSGEDSFSFWKVLNDETDKPIRHSMVHHSASRFYSLRNGDWKYINGLGSGGFSNPTRLTPEKNGPQSQLYNLNDDPLESQNLFFKHPDKVSELSSKLQEIVGKGTSH